MGTIGWFARNQVAANLLMALILVAGIVTVSGTTDESGSGPILTWDDATPGIRSDTRNRERSTRCT